MDKKSKIEAPQSNEIKDEDSAFEIIELAIDDINVLTKAFQIINTICEELTVDETAEEEEDLHGIPEYMMH